METVTEDLGCSSITPPLSEAPLTTSNSGGVPPGYENVPPELYPDANGKPPQLTERLLRKLRAKYFSIKHPVLENCGHKLDLINFPNTHCENCLYTFFNTHPQLVEVTDQFYRTHGKNPLIAMRGVKYFRAFMRYMATVIQFMKEEGRLPSEDVNQPNPGTLGDGTIAEEAELIGAAEALDQSGEAVSGGGGYKKDEY